MCYTVLGFLVKMAGTNVISFVTASPALGPCESAHICDVENGGYDGNVVMLLDVWTERLRVQC
jgi:hypothetical protein